MTDIAALEKRIEEAVEEGDLAFWEQIAKAFPEATTGDLDPEASRSFTAACTEAARAWLSWNLPKEAGGELLESSA